MREARHSTSRAKRFAPLAATVALFAAALLAVPSPAPACQNWTDYFTYYDDANHDNQVGWCEFDCYCVTYCDGTRTQYWTHQSWSGCLSAGGPQPTSSAGAGKWGKAELSPGRPQPEWAKPIASCAPMSRLSAGRADLIAR